MSSHAPRHARPAATLLRVLVAALGAALLLSACGPAEQEKKAETPRSSQDGPGEPEETEEPPPPPEPAFGMPRVGQCVQMSQRQTRAAVSTGRPVRCRAPHTAVVSYAAVQPTAITAQTPPAQRRALAYRVCRPAFARLVGGDPALRAASLLTWVFFTPSAEQLERGARWVRCDVLARSGRTLVPLAPGRPLLRAGLGEQLRICQNERNVDVSCTKPHVFRVAAVFRAPGAAYPDATTLTPVARDRCRELMGAYGGYWQPPSRPGWRQGDRFVRCLARTETVPTS